MRQALSTLWSSDLFLDGGRDRRADRPGKRGRKLVEAVKCAASGTRRNPCKSLCLRHFRERPSRSSTGREDSPPRSCLYVHWARLAIENSGGNETMRLRPYSLGRRSGFRSGMPQNRLNTEVSSLQPIWGAPATCSILRCPRGSFAEHLPLFLRSFLLSWRPPRPCHRMTSRPICRR